MIKNKINMILATTMIGVMVSSPVLAGASTLELNSSVDNLEKSSYVDTGKVYSAYDYDSSLLSLDGKWELTKYKDGTIAITGYKGHEVNVTVPRVVTAMVLPKYPIETVHNATFLDYTVDRIEGSVCDNKVTQTVTVEEGFTSMPGFSGATALKSVNLPKSMTTLSHEPFSGCTSLEGIELPNSITALDENTFKGCTNLKYVVFPSNLKYIPSSCCSGLTNLQTVKIGSGTVGIENNAFYNCENLNVIDLMNVSNIGVKAFCACYSLKTISGGGASINLESSAFLNCKSLTDMNNSIHLKDIGESAFRNTKFSAITFSDSLKKVESNAFNGTNIQTVDIPGSVDSIGDCAFPGLTSVTLHEGLKSFGVNSFGSNLTSINIPSSVISVPASAFKGNTKLVSVKLNEGLCSIKKDAFEGCYNLTLASLPSSLVYIDNGAFSGCALVKILSLPTTVKYVGPNAFTGSGSNPSLDGKFGTYGGRFLFKENSDLENFSLFSVLGELSDNKELVIPSGFSNYDSIDSYTELNDDYHTIAIAENAFTGKSMTSVVIPEGVKEIGKNAFKDCKDLSSITFPSTLEKIDDGAFNGCSKLLTIRLPKTIKSIGADAFTGTLVNYPDLSSKTEVKYNSFNKGITIGGLSSFTESGNISAGMFDLLHSSDNQQFADTTLFGHTVEEITGTISARASSEILPNGNTSYVLKGDVVLPNSIKSISNYCLLYTSIESLTIPYNATMGEYTVPSDCKVYTTKTEKVNLPNVGTTDIVTKYSYNEMTTSVVTGNKGTIVRYVLLTGAKSNASAIEIGTLNGLSVKEIGSNLDVNKDTLTSVKINDGVTTIKANAFVNCSKLTDLYLPLSLTTIEKDAFKGTNLKTIKYAGHQADWEKIKSNFPADVSVEFIKSYNVVFKDFDNKELKNDTVDAGSKITAPTNPRRDGYTFVKWDKEFNVANSDLVIIAVYEKKATSTPIATTSTTTVKPEEQTPIATTTVNPAITTSTPIATSTVKPAITTSTPIATTSTTTVKPEEQTPIATTSTTNVKPEVQTSTVKPDVQAPIATSTVKDVSQSSTTTTTDGTNNQVTTTTVKDDKTNSNVPEATNTVTKSAVTGSEVSALPLLLSFAASLVGMSKGLRKRD